MACTAHNVTPWGPDTLSFALLLGDQELEGVQVLGLEEAEEEASLEAEDPLFRVTQRWLLPTLQTPVPEALHCQATMRLPGLALSHRRRLPGKQVAPGHPLTLTCISQSGLATVPSPWGTWKTGLHLHCATLWQPDNKS